MSRAFAIVALFGVAAVCGLDQRRSPPSNVPAGVLKANEGDAASYKSPGAERELKTPPSASVAPTAPGPVTINATLATETESCGWYTTRECPKPSYKAQVWTSESFKDNNHDGIDDFAWPEQQLPGWGGGTANVGVAFSGGGMRAYTSGYGQLRGLRALGKLGEVRYMAGISGGSWLIANYIYARGVTDDSKKHAAPHRPPCST